MFSIIIPLYNKAAYIEKAICSVLNQTFQEFELIIVDDGSTDNPFQFEGSHEKLSLKDLCKLNDKITLIEQKNQGVSTARNNGVKLVKYDYIAFLDADDWWEPTYLEEMKGLIEEFTEAGIYGCSYYKVKNGKLIQAIIGVENDFQRGLINYCRVYARTMYMPLFTSATIIKRDIYISEKGFNPILKLGEDFDLWIRVALKYPVAFLNKALVYYNQDVDLEGRAIGAKIYKPQEHMLFSDYSTFKNNPDFIYLFEVLALYGLLPYYLAGKYTKEVKKIILDIHWKNHPVKYRIYYQILPKEIVKLWFLLIKIGFSIKNKAL